MDKLKLTFPSHTPGTQLLVKTKPAELQAWIEQLPAGNMAKYVELVGDAVANLNRTELSINKRAPLISLFDEAYERIHDYYRPLMKSGPYKGAHAPIEEIEAINRLTKEMSFAYKIAVTEYQNKRVFFGKNKDLAHSINMAIHYLTLILLENYELYSPVPLHIWKETHQLYHYAEHNELSEVKLPQKKLRHTLDCAEDTYIRSCMIAVSNPYHQKRGDHWEVFHYLSYWHHLVVLSEDPQDYRKVNCFVIDITDDDKPNYLAKLPRDDQHNLRFLLSNKLINKIDEQLRIIENDNRAPSDCFSKNVIARKAKELLNNLHHIWQTKLERVATRYPKMGKMEVIFGLSSIHKILRHYDPLQTSQAHPLAKADEILIEQQWQTVNSSDGGTCIAQRNLSVHDLNVGMLVSIRETIEGEKPSAWKLGEICWITGSKREGTQVGIKYIKGDIQPVEVASRKGKKIETSFQPGLMLTGTKLKGLSTPTLVAKVGLYSESRPMYLRVGEAEQRIHARTRVSSTGLVERFFFDNDAAEERAELEAKVKRAAELEDRQEQNANDDNSADEVINIEGLPGQVPRPEDFEKTKTLDDVIVKKH